MPLGCTKSSITTLTLPVFGSTRKTLCLLCSISPWIALVPTSHAIGRIGEPDRSVGSDDGVVRRVELLAAVTVGNDGDGAIVLGARHAPPRVLAGDQTPFAIHGVAVRIERRIAEDAQMIVVLQQTHHPVVRNIAEDQVAAGCKVCRALGPSKAGGDPLNGTGPDAALEPLIERFDVLVRIARVGQWSQGKRPLAGPAAGPPFPRMDLRFAALAAFATATVATAAEAAKNLRLSMSPHLLCRMCSG